MKAPDSFVPENPLEESLVRAVQEPVFRPQFLRDLLGAQIYFIWYGPPESAPSERGLHVGDRVPIQPYQLHGRLFLPVFSSVTRLRMVITQEVTHLRPKARDFFSLTQGADVVLNPGSPYGKELLAGEISALLNGTYGQPTEVWRLDQPKQVLFGRPARYPHELAKALQHCFARHPGVQRAWLTLYQDPARDAQPNLLVGIQADESWEELQREVGELIRCIPVPDPPVDLTQVTDPDLIPDFFRNTEPFYRKEPDGPVWQRLSRRPN